MNKIITLQNVTKIFSEKRGLKIDALKNINLEIFEGEFFVFVGPSGSGKSTLLRIMSGLEKEYHGAVNFSGNISRPSVGFVFQQFALLPWLTIYQNVELGLIPRQLSSHEKKEIIEKELKRLGLLKFAEAYPRELSGGMRQRVGIARAFVTEPKLVFMDEPFSELDSFTAEELRKELLDIWQERKPTIIMVTHLVEEAILLADRIAVLTPQPGRIEKIVVNSLPRPRNKRTHDFYQLEDQLYKLIRP